MASKPIILKLGGSLVIPKDIDTSYYLKKFRKFIENQTRNGKRFIIIVGGGQTNRWYRDKAIKAGVKDATDLHWIGTISTQLNAELVRAVLGKLAHPRTYCDYSKNIKWQEPILVVGGSKPGHSTDNDAVLMAKKFKSKTIINMSNVHYLYTKDPKKFSGAKPIQQITWKDFRAMFGNPTKHLPGQNIPIDAIAALQSQKYKIETFYIGGENLANLGKLLSNKKWEGTRIYSE